MFIKPVEIICGKPFVEGIIEFTLNNINVKMFQGAKIQKPHIPVRPLRTGRDSNPSRLSRDRDSAAFTIEEDLMAAELAKVYI
jgi:hypothetical protein